MVTTVAAPAATTGGTARQDRSLDPPARWAFVLLIALSVFYFAFGTVLVLRYNLFDPDGPSRVANAGYVFMSRHPHLSAIGFVWNPLPSLMEIPLIPLSRWWPEMLTRGLAGVVQSALFMACAALMIRRIALDCGVPTAWRWPAVACFALHPMIIVYGASGMSEAAETFCLIWCCRHLLQWLRFQRVGDLAWAGIALGVGYLARYEVVTATIGVALLVGVVIYWRSPRGDRLNATILAVIIVVLPFAAAFTIWAATGWVVTGELFATLSSAYGNESQVAAADSIGGEGASSDWVVVTARLLGMQPFAILATAGAVAMSIWRRRIDAVAPIATFGPVLGFAMWSQYTSMTFGWFRFYLLAVPLILVIGLVCWRPQGSAPLRSRSSTAETRAGAILLTGSLIIGFPVTGYAMLDQRIGNQHMQFGLQSLLDPQQYPANEMWYRRIMVNDRWLAKYFDQQRLPDGSVLMDTFLTWGIWLSSDDPKQFVITSDYDFVTALNRPWERGIRYIVVANPSLNVPDALIRRYPTMWEDGADIGELVLSVDGPTGDEMFRVYRVTEPPKRLPPDQISQAGFPFASGPSDPGQRTSAEPSPPGG